MDALGTFLRSLYVLGGGYLGYVLGMLLSKQFVGFSVTNAYYLAVAGAMALFLMSSWLEGRTRGVVIRVQRSFSGLEPRQVTAFIVGAIGALLVSVLLSSLLQNTILDNLFVKFVTTLVLGAFFTFFTVQNSEFFSASGRSSAAAKPMLLNAKVLDTNVIIDGRITELAASGFLEGTLVVPTFVLRELQYIADEGDVTKRTRGRRGLEVLEALQSMRPLKVLDWDAPDLQNVDDKLVRLTRELGGKLVSNDYNLSKVAKLQEIEVLNLNELALAIRAKYAAGDILSITLTKEGNQPGQGVGYLEDGTMVVVDGGLVMRGKTARVLVQSNIQTAMGRMIFAKLEE